MEENMQWIGKRKKHTQGGGAIFETLYHISWDTER
jgi:hypothetical protein